MNKVSVILTSYNGEKTIERTIHSILNQNGINEKFLIELISIDDCSSDSTNQIISQFDVIKLNTPKNSGGPNAGRNIGLIKATGDYICIADQDDIWEKNKIIKLLPHLQNTTIVSSGYKLFDTSQNKEFIRGNKSESGFILFPENETFLKRLTKSSSGQSTYLGSLIFKQSLKKILFEEKYGMVDFDWMVQLFHNQKSIEVCEPLYTRYVDGNNLSLNESYREKDFNFSLKFIKKYIQEYPKEVKIAHKKIHGSRARYYYIVGDMKKARYFFLKSSLNLKTFAYYVTTFVGSKYVKKKFNVFG
jgi:glycosyltransferase involved in cell wall biosynthesis